MTSSCNVGLSSPDDFSFRIDPTRDAASSGTNHSVPVHLREQFRQDGFIVFPSVLDASVVQALNIQLEEILRGRYDRQEPPDKQPKLIQGKLKENGGSLGWLGFSGNLQNVRVLQVINVHKCNTLFRAIETSSQLGQVVAELAGWKGGVRLAQDQIWAKPPGAAPLVFHRDSPYFMFDPPNVVTVWIALDDMEEDLGPLEYARGSHRWGEGRCGSANQFFQASGGMTLLNSAAERAGVTMVDIVSMAGLKAGGISIHDGLTWHGSGKNVSKTKPRRGLGLHFVPAEVKFTSEATKSRLWRSYVKNVDNPFTMPLPDEDFPITWKPSDTANIC